MYLFIHNTMKNKNYNFHRKIVNGLEIIYCCLPFILNRKCIFLAVEIENVTKSFIFI